MKYVVILEEDPKSWGAYVSGLPGCVASGETRGKALKLIREAIEFHLDGIKEKEFLYQSLIHTARWSR